MNNSIVSPKYGNSRLFYLQSPNFSESTDANNLRPINFPKGEGWMRILSTIEIPLTITGFSHSNYIIDPYTLEAVKSDVFYPDKYIAYKIQAQTIRNMTVSVLTPEYISANINSINVVIEFYETDPEPI